MSRETVARTLKVRNKPDLIMPVTCKCFTFGEWIRSVHPIRLTCHLCPFESLSRVLSVECVDQQLSLRIQSLAYAIAAICKQT